MAGCKSDIQNIVVPVASEEAYQLLIHEPALAGPTLPMSQRVAQVASTAKKTTLRVLAIQT